MNHDRLYAEIKRMARDITLRDHHGFLCCRELLSALCTAAYFSALDWKKPWPVKNALPLLHVSSHSFWAIWYRTFFCIYLRKCMGSFHSRCRQELIFSWGNLFGKLIFLFYGELPVHMERRRNKGSRQMHEGIKVTSGEWALQGITDYKIFSLKTKLNRHLWNNEV